MTDDSIEVNGVEDATPTLRTLLGEFHEWMADAAPVSYDPDSELVEDVTSLATESASWAWVARRGGEPAGCVLLYGESDELAEFRRLWVRSAHRGHGVGRRLVETVSRTARTNGYGTLALTTPPWSEAAQALYESLGFDRTPPYPETRLDERHHDDAIFMQLSLDGSAAGSDDVETSSE